MKRKAKPGRPTKLTPQLQAKVIKGIGLGMSLEQASIAVGISDATLHRWLTGDPAGAEFREFREAVREARAKRTSKLLEHVWRSMKDIRVGPTLQRGDWKAAWKVLETLEPKDFGLKVRLIVTEELTELLTELKRVLPPQWFSKVLEVAMALGSGADVGGGSRDEEDSAAIVGRVGDPNPAPQIEGVRPAPAPATPP